MEKNSILEFNNKENVSDVLNELLRNGVLQLIHQAVEAEKDIIDLFSFAHNQESLGMATL